MPDDTPFICLQCAQAPVIAPGETLCPACRADVERWVAEGKAWVAEMEAWKQSALRGKK